MQRLAVIALACAAAAPALAQERLACGFVQACIAGQPCTAVEEISADLVRQGDGYRLAFPDQAQATFKAVPGAAGTGLQLLSTDIDPDADAVALLSIAPDGQAILTTHGSFPNLGGVTHLGTCVTKDG